MKKDSDALRPASFNSGSINTAEPGVKERIEKKAKHILHLGSSPDESEDKECHAAVEELETSPAFNPSKLLNKARVGTSGMTSKVINLVQGTAAAIVHPKAAIKERATRKTAGSLAKSRPYLSRQADLDFLEAHDDLERAEDQPCGSDEEDTAVRKRDDIDHCGERIEDLERSRKNMRVAWVTARHVRRVRVVDPTISRPFPADPFFEREDDCGFVEFDWSKWIGYKLLYKTHSFSAQYIDDFERLPFDADTLRKHIERLITVSAPIQTFFLDARRVYRWEDPWRTGRNMVTYFFLLHISHIMTYVYGYVVYSTIMNYYYPKSVQSLREGIARSLDRGATALKVGELMDQHGSNDWLAPLLEEIGPHIQVCAADLASLLEAGYNFYHFQNPRATWASLCLVASLCLATGLADSRTAMKLLWGIGGLIFFVCFPISSLCPRYRLLVSPLKWVFWDVPNHPEWCFQYLQERADVVKQGLQSRDTTDGDEELWFDATEFLSPDTPGTPVGEAAQDVLSFGCAYQHVPGRFIVSTQGLRFTATLGELLPHDSFDISYGDVVEMSKQETKASTLKPLAKVTTGLDKLELKIKQMQCTNEAIEHSRIPEIVLLENMRGRDKAFNAVIAFSGVRWQHLQQVPHT